MMNADQLKQIKTKLLALKAELQLIEQTSHEATDPVELDQARVGRLSRMDAMQSQQMALETTRRRQEQLIQIEGTLLRLDSENYGYCSICEEEIDLRRLMINPANTRCIKCADK